MVWPFACGCNEEKEIDSFKAFAEIKTFFDQQVAQGALVEEIPQKPFYVWKEADRTKERFATKWYRCLKCGCLWEVNYPDFPANGFVRKFPDGIYKERGY